MSWEMVWELPWVSLRSDRVKEAAAALEAKVPGLRTRVEVEAKDTVNLFVEVPRELLDPEELEGVEEGTLPVVELSFYDLDEEGRVMSLEAEFSDNAKIPDSASDVGDLLAGILGGKFVED